MLTIESKKVDVQKSANSVFDFLIDLNNLEKLMPEGKIENWRSTDKTCRFAIKNLGTIGMKHKSIEASSKLVLESDGKNPFPFTLTIFVDSDQEDNAKSYFVFDGEVNMFMSTMVKKPLKQFFDQLAENLVSAV